MPVIRKHDTCFINEWQLHEVEGAFDVAAHPLNSAVADRQCSKQATRFESGSSCDWLGGINSLDDARKLLTEGWPDGVKRLESAIADFTPPDAQTRVRRVAWRDQGDELSVDRAMRGEFDTAWRTSKRKVTRGPQTIELYSIYGGCGGLSAEEIFWNGAACCAIADRLESAGYAVRIVGCFVHGYKGSPGILTTSDGVDDDGRRDRYCRSDVVIKEASEPLRLDGLASILCHAGVYRTFLFRTWCTMPLKMNDGLGPAIYTWTDKVQAALAAAGEWPEGAIVIDAAYDRDACKRRVAEVVARVEAMHEGE